MIKIWSELPVARTKEQLADVATLGWVVFWGSIVWQLFQFLSAFAEAGRTIRAGGDGLVQGGRDLGESLAGLPLVGSQVRDIARDAIGGAGRPLSDFGTQLEQFIFVVAIVLALLLALVTLGPWLSRYLPWRWERLRRVAPRIGRSGRRPSIGEASVERTLAMRAVTRLDYSTLLEFTPDPLGDWAAASRSACSRRARQRGPSSLIGRGGGALSRFRAGRRARRPAAPSARARRASTSLTSEPSRRSRVVDETRTSSASPRAMTRDAACTASPRASSPMNSTSPVWIPTRIGRSMARAERTIAAGTADGPRGASKTARKPSPVVLTSRPR